MSVTKCRCVRNGGGLADRTFRYWAEYEIDTDDRTMAWYDVISGALTATPHNFPDYFDAYSLFGDADLSAFMQTANCEQSSQNGTRWTARAEWFPIENTEELDNHTSRENPLNRRVIYDREWEEIALPVEKGWNQEALPGISRLLDAGGPIQNAAGQEPSTPIIKTKRIPVIVAQKNYATLEDIDDIEKAHGDSLNNAAFGQWAEGECLFRGVTASKAKYEGGQRYYTGTIRIACQEGGWDYEMVNRGFKFLSGGTLKEATVEDANGDQVPVAEPINLELDGSRTPDGSIGTVIPYRLSRKTDFSLLGI